MSTRPVGRGTVALVVAVLALSIVGVGVMTGTVAANTTSAPDCSTIAYEGDGTSSNPYQVGNVDQLQCINDQDRSAHYVLVSDIDASGTDQWNGGTGFDPIGDSTTPFTGNFDGQGYEISGLYIDVESVNGGGYGLFGRTEGNVLIENVGVVNADVSVTRQTTGALGVGILVGAHSRFEPDQSGPITLSNVYVTGDLYGESSNVGGLLGLTVQPTTRNPSSWAEISGSWADVRIQSTTDSGTVEQASDAGGLVGVLGADKEGPSSITNSFALGTIEDAKYSAGGLVGDGYSNVADNNVIESSFAAVNLTSVSGADTGGIGGYMTDTDLIDLYWDVPVSGETTARGAGDGNETNLNGLDTAEMQDANASGNMSALGFPDTWQAVNDDYPVQSALYSVDVVGTNSPIQTGLDDPDGNETEVVADIGISFAGHNATGPVELRIFVDGGTDSSTRHNTTFSLSRGGNTTVQLINDNISAEDATLEVRLVDPSTVTVAQQTIEVQVAPDCSKAAYDGDGTAGNPYVVTNMTELQCIGDPATVTTLSDNYELGDDIEAGNEDNGTQTWNDGAGFTPLGDAETPFTGSFDGAGHTVANLTIDRADESDVGLFGVVGSSGTVSNVTLEAANVTGGFQTGGLVGELGGTVENVHATGDVDGGSSEDVGGLVGYGNGSTLDGVSSAVDVTGGNDVGGLLGSLGSSGTVIDSYATGNATGTGNATDTDGYIGGLVGFNSGQVTNGSASGDVSGTGNNVGGLVGYNNGDVTRSSATGNVTGDDSDIGGLIGASNGVVSFSYATGTVTATGGKSDHGGLIGDQRTDGVVKDSYATGDVYAPSDTEVGGLIGDNGGVVKRSYATGTVTGSSSTGGEPLTVLDDDDEREDESSDAANAGTVEAEDDERDDDDEREDDDQDDDDDRDGPRRGPPEHAKNAGGPPEATGTTDDDAEDQEEETAESTVGPDERAVVTSSSTVGGLIGSNNYGTVTNSYWDTQTTGQDASSGGTGLLTVEMTGDGATNAMDGFDFGSVWDVVDQSVGNNEKEVSYPFLRNNTEDPEPGRQTVSETADFDVTITDTSDFARPGETLVVNATIRNLGYASGDQTVEFTVNGSLESSRTVSLDSAAETTVNFTYVASDADKPEVTAAVASDNDSESRDVLVTDSEAPECGNVGYPGSGTSDDPYEIDTVEQLQCIEDQGLDSHYELVSNVDASGTFVWNGQAGFDPVGNASVQFTGTLDGAGHTVTGLTINRSSTGDVGLFGGVGSAGTVRNITLDSVDVTGGGSTGSLVGDLGGVVEDAHARGAVDGGSNDDIGGLVGSSPGATVSNSSATVEVSGDNDVAGLVGDIDSGSIVDSHATGNVTGTADELGGLVGEGNDVEVRNSYATGDVEGVGSDSDKSGGLVGSLGDGASTILNSYATGNVVATDYYAGGLAGEVGEYTEIIASHATGDVSAGDSYAGGLVGETDDPTEVRFSYATGDVSADSGDAGGLIGAHDGGEVRYSFATGDVEGAGFDTGGLIGDSDAFVANVYATGDVSGDQEVGGLIGDERGGTIERAYASGTVEGSSEVAGLVGELYGTLEDSYWDVLATNQTVAVDSGTAGSGVVGFDTDDGQGRADEMTGSDAPGNMVALDFTGQWMTRTDDYPALPYQFGNGPPIAEDDSYQGKQLLSVYAPGVLDNDVDPELDDLSASVSTPPANGNVTLSADGSFEYVPDIGFDGVDTFVYAASDGVDTDTATVTIDVTDPRLVADDLEVAPTSVSAGEIVTVSANFTNPTNETVAKKATVMADGQRLNSESVTLESGETKRVSVDVTLYRSGDRAVSFPDFDGNETVTVERTVSDREWESWHLNPEHRNFDPTISGPRQPVSELWNTALPDGYNVPMRPVVVNDTIFASSYESTFAMDARTGDLLWNNASVLGTYLGGIAHDDGRLFVSTSLGEFHALDAETGDGLWARQDIGTYDTAPAVNDGTVFIPGDNSDMWALDAATGNTVWSVTYSDARYPADYAAPTAVDGRVFVPLPNGTLIAHDAATGETLWKQDIGYTEATPAVANGTVYISDSGDSAPYLHAFDVETGQEEWNATAGYGYTGLSVTEDTVYAASCGNSVFAYDADTGEKQWDRSDIGCAYDVSEPVTVGNYLYVTRYNFETLVLNRYTGETEFTITNPTGYKFTSPTPYRGVLYFADRYSSGGISAYGGPEQPMLEPGSTVYDPDAPTTLTVLKEYRNETVANATLTIEETGDTLDAGADGTVDYAFPGTGTYSVTITAPSTTINNYVETTREVEVLEAVNFTASVDANESVVAGEQVVVDATIENTGVLQDTQEIKFTVDGGVEETRTLTLNGSELTAETFTYPTDDTTPSTITVGVETDNDTASTTVDVDAPAESTLSDLDIAGQGTDATIDIGDDENVSVDVTNVGDLNGTIAVTLDIVDGNGTSQVNETQSVSVEAGDTVQVTFSGVTGDLASGEYVVEMSSDDESIQTATVSPNADSTSGTLTVGEPAESTLSDLDIAGQGTNATITEGDDEDVSVDVTNVGDQSGSFDVTLFIDGVPSLQVTETLGPGETRSLTFPEVTGTLAPGEHTVAVSTTDDVLSINEDALTGNLTVEQEATAALSNLDVAGQGANATITEGDDENIGVVVENGGDQSGSFDVTLAVGDTQQTRTTGDLAPGETETVTFENATGDLGPGAYDVTVSTADDAISGDLTVESPAESTLMGLDIAGQGANATVSDDDNETVAVVVENAGDQSESFAVTLDVGDVQRTETTGTLAGGETETVTFENATGDLAPGEYTVTMSTADDTLTGNLTVEQGATAALSNLDVAGQGANATITEGANETVAVVVENVGEQSGAFQVTLDVGGTQRTETTDVLASGETETVTFENATGDLAPGEYTVTVSTADNSVEGTLTVQQEATSVLTNLDVAGQGANATIAAGDDEDISVVVENVGDQSGSFDVTLALNDTQQMETTGDLAPGETETVTFENVTGDLALGEYTVTVSTADDAVAGNLTVDAPAESTLMSLDIAGQGANATITEGANETVAVVVENVGDQSGSFQVTLAVGDAVDRSQSTGDLAPGGTETVTFANATGDLAPGEYDVTVVTADDTLTGNLTVTQSATAALRNLDVAGQGANATIAEGDNESVSVTVENVGEQSGSFDVTLDVGDLQETATTAALAPGETETVTFENATGDIAPGEHDVTVSTADDAITGTLTVDQSATSALSDLDVAGQGANATITEGDEEDVSVVVENAGDLAGSFAVTLDVGGAQHTETTGDLAGGETETVTFKNVTGDLAPGEYNVTVTTADDAITGTLTVQQSGMAALSALDVGGQGANATLVAGNATNASVVVENVGEATESFNVMLAIGDDLTATESTGQLGSGETETVTFENIAGDLDSGTYDVTASASNASAEGTLDVLVPATFTITDVNTESAGPGQDLEVTVTVENTGEVTETQTVTFREATKLSPYADDDGIVGTQGVLVAISDWRDGEISTSTLFDVIDAWKSGENVDGPVVETWEATLEGGETATHTFTDVPTSGDRPAKDYRVQTGDDSVLVTVEIT